MTLPTAFRRQWLASGVSNIGDGMEAAAGPLLAASLTNDPRLIALVGVGATLPWLLLSLPLGVVIDRLDRRTLMVRANIARCTLFALIALLAATGAMNIGLLVVIVTLIGAFEVVFDMSAQAFLPSIVPAEMLEKANGRLFATEVICNTFLGLPLGAWAFVAAIGVPFAVNAASFGVAAYLVASIRATIPMSSNLEKETGSPTGERDSFRSQLAAGLRWLFAHRLLRTLAILLGICNMATQMGQALFVKYASDELGVTGRGYGVLLAAMSAGSILGGVAGDRVSSRFGTSSTIIVSYSTFAVSSLAMGIWRNIPVALVASTVTAIAGTVWNVATVSLRQRIIPSDLFGRVNSAYRFIGTGFIAVGSAVGGFIAKSHGYAAPFLVGGVIVFAAISVGAPLVARHATDSDL
ncbi:MAG: MFS transporter [Acidobacteria bacterium]|nr:MFS transporter [Acidobacteriota bacterium]